MKLSSFICFVALLTLPLASFAQTPAFVNQIIDFENNSTAGFSVGGGAAAVQPSLVGDGAGNIVLQLQTNGNAGGSGSNLLVLNNAFSGDFSTVNSILFDATNPNAVDLNVRFGFSAGPPSSAFVSKDIVLAAGTSQALSFAFSPSNFTQVVGTNSFANTISAVDQIRILHNPLAVGGVAAAAGDQVFDAAGDPIAATLQIDNFQITSVPEPGCISLLLGLGGTLILSRRK